MPAMPNLASTTLSVAHASESLSVRRFTVTEKLSSLFDLSITVGSPLDDIDLEAIVGHPASLRLSHTDAEGVTRFREWRGVCYHFEQVSAESTGVSMYVLRVAPTLWLLSQRTNARIFQHKTIPEIVGGLLDEWKIRYSFEIDPTAYPALEYRVQYGETDFAFLSRLLEEVGISYRFDLADEDMVVVFSDAPERRAARGGGPIPYVDAANLNVPREVVTAVRVRRDLRPGALTLRDFDFRGRADYELFGKATATKSDTTASVVEAELERFRYAPGEFVDEASGAAAADQRQGSLLAARSLEALRATALTVSFDTNAIDLAVGTVFSFSGHPQTRISAPRELLVIEVTVDGMVGFDATVTATATPCDTPFRPAQSTPRPRIHGAQSATVVGPEGEEIYTDEYGRVRVQFHWDREGERDENSSCWIRVSQAWAGAGFGMLALPRVGQEVTVGFFEGNPDDPVIVGRVYNALNRPAYKLPEEKTKSGWRTRSSPGDEKAPGYNELTFDDSAGAELVSLRAQRDLQKLVRANESARTGRDLTISVGSNRTATVGGVDTTAVGARHVVTIQNSATMIEMTEAHIVATTGQASVTWAGPDLSLEAKGNITITAHEGDVVIKGGPNVKINC